MLPVEDVACVLEEFFFPQRKLCWVDFIRRGDFAGGHQALNGFQVDFSFDFGAALSSFFGMCNSFPRWSWEHSSYLATGPEIQDPL